MPYGDDNDRLSWGDAIFLYLEREGMPLHIASVNIFEGVVPLADFSDLLEAKIEMLPRYRQCVVTPPFHVGLPIWQYDVNFGMANHLREIKLKLGTEAELKHTVAKVLSKVMDRQRPLWDVTLIRGLKDNRTAMVFRVHHCLADGIAGVGLMNVLLDANPTVSAPATNKHRFHAPKPKDPLTLLLDGWLSSFGNLVDRVLTAQSEVAAIAQRVVAGRGALDANGHVPADDFTHLLREFAEPTQRLCFNVTCRGPEKFAWGEISLPEIKAIKNECGASVNDVALALVTMTIRRYVELHGDEVAGRTLRIMVPINLRGTDEASELGNRISLVPLTVPLDIRNPRKLLEAIHERMIFLKTTHVAELVSLGGNLVGTTPAALQAFVGPIASQLPITPFNMVCTNVPGPQIPLYLLGHKMLQWYPYVPIGGEMALNCALLSYNGMMHFGFSGEVHAAPDLYRLERFLAQSMTELKKSLAPPRRHRSPKRKTRLKPERTAPMRTKISRGQTQSASAPQAPAPSASAPTIPPARVQEEMPGPEKAGLASA